MKNKLVFTLLLVTAIAISLSFGLPPSKKFQILPARKIEGKAYFNDINNYEINILNKTDTILNISWELVENTLVKGWDYSMCNYGQCLIGIPASGKMKPLKKGEKGFITVHVDPQQIRGTGTVKFYVHETADKTKGEIITYIITATSEKSKM